MYSFGVYIITDLFLFCVLSPYLSAIQFNDANSISRYLARVAPALGLYGANMMEQTEVCVCVCVIFSVLFAVLFSSFEMLPGICRSTTGWSSVLAVCVVSLV